MFDESGLQQHAACRADETSGSRHERPNLFTSPKSRGQEFGVEIEEHDHIDSANAVQNRFGSDKPDMRFGMEIQDFCEEFRTSGFKVFAGTVESGGVVKAFNAKGLAD
ncbi:MAG: hypothetical protein ACO3TV_10805, partial [Ilumatobacteraceae bacterium]